MGEGATILGLPKVGDTIAGKYAVVRVIGEGGMGVVFEATHVRIQQRVAIKVLQPHTIETGEVVSRFDREARAAGRLKGRHVARVLDVDFTAERLPYMVMEYLEGHDLQTELEARGVFPLEEAVDYVLQGCAGIAEAHDIGIIHRDLKPSNLFLCVEEGRRVVKILDFGISKVLGEASKLTSTELTIGTPLYMSPEQVRSAKNVDARTDVWALGIILYELLCGRPPWIGSGPSVAAAIVTDDPPPIAEFRADVPAGLEAVIRGALAKKPEERMRDVRELAAALEKYAGPSNSLGRQAFENALRVSQSAPRRAAELAPTLPAITPPIDRGPRPVSGEAATMSATSTATALGPSSAPRSGNRTTAGWTTGAGRSGLRKSSRLLFAAAVLFAVGSVSAYASVRTLRRTKETARAETAQTALAAASQAPVASADAPAPPSPGAAPVPEPEPPKTPVVPRPRATVGVRPPRVAPPPAPTPTPTQPPPPPNIPRHL